MPTSFLHMSSSFWKEIVLFISMIFAVFLLSILFDLIMPKTSTFIINLPMISIFLVLVSTALSQNQMALRTGIAQLELGSLSYAAYNIVFNKSLPDSVYNSMVSVSYVTNMALTNGLIINSVCPNTTQTNMGCTITANSDNQNNIVYMSYVASDVGSLVVGMYSYSKYQHNEAFQFTNTTSVNQTLTFKPMANSSYFNNSNALFVNYFPIVSGVSSLDPDFSLTMASLPFNALTMEISLQVAISQFQAKNVTIHFGYMLYDASIITISLYEGQQLVPNSIPNGYIFGINTILSKNATTPRRLQVVPPQVLATADATMRSAPSIPVSPVIPIIKSMSPLSEVYPVIITKNQTQIANTSSSAATVSAAAASKAPAAKIANNTDSSRAASKAPSSNPANFAPPQQSSTAQALRSAKNQVKIIPRPMDPTLFSSVMQPDGVIDANATAIPILQSMGVLPYAMSSLQGINPQMFNTFFSTNGFVVLTSADDIDQIYYCQVNPVQNLQPQTVSVYYRSVVTNIQQKPVCSVGEVVGILQRVDYIQKKIVLTCMACLSGMYFDLSKKTCLPFPIISKYLNQVDNLG